jgi:hypothetical protein
MSGPVVSTTIRVSDGMGKLVFDKIRPDLQNFI